MVPGDILDNDCDGQIDEEKADGIDNDGDGLIDEDLAVPPRINGNWGEWTDYSSCSVTCGDEEGTMTRTRECDNPAPANNGDPCVGEATETITCNADVPCTVPVDGNWGEWSDYGECSVTCGEGTYTRTRVCDSPAPADGGADCEGEAEETSTCDAGACPVDGNWGEWTEYGSCSLTCGDGTRTRSRMCDAPAPANGGADCQGDAEEAEPCHEGDCPVDGNWGEWSDYGSCSATCGEGTMTRVRACDSPAPQMGGADCEGDAEESASCNEGECPVPGSWGEWSDYGSCSVTCGEGVKTRSRACDSPAPKNGGDTCAGDAEETATCEEEACPTPCVGGGGGVGDGWSDWGPWGTCDASCYGTQWRSRGCLGTDREKCPGDAAEMKVCRPDLCSCAENAGLAARVAELEQQLAAARK